MNCPVCKRDLAPSLSICLTCGAMMNDSVREELETKIGRVSGPLSKPEIKEPEAFSEPVNRSPQAAIRSDAVEPVIPPKRTITAELPRKHTSPTLVEFQNRNATVPEWRLQIQNTVRQRVNGGSGDRNSAFSAEAGAGQAAYPTNGAAALKMEFVEEQTAAGHQNDKVAKALQRIEASRRTFLPETSSTPTKAVPPSKNYPFNVVSRVPEAPTLKQPVPHPDRTQPTAKPKLVSSLRIEKKPYDTSKLPPIPQPAKLHSSFDEEFVNEPIEKEKLEKSAIEFSRVVIGKSEPEPEIIHEETGQEPEVEEFDDLAPVSMRFGAGLFDAIIAGFASLIILSPFMVNGGTWLSISGALAFGATMFVFLFLYLTASLAFWGKTFGMRIFSLELIDAEENNYPTVHQAAVNSAVYLMSITFAGLGFITIFFNEEKRAVHDLVSGTLLVREI